MSAVAARPRLTPHQREVLTRCERLDRHGVVLTVGTVGSRSALEHLADKGYLRRLAPIVGPRGGERARYTIAQVA